MLGRFGPTVEFGACRTDARSAHTDERQPTLQPSTIATCAAARGGSCLTQPIRRSDETTNAHRRRAPAITSAAIVNHMANNALLDRAFVACSHPIRRGILERLAGGEMTVGEATGDFGVSKPAISKHLKLLEEAGAITRVIDGRTHRLRLREQPLDEAYAWMTNQRELWERKLDTVDQYLREQRERQQPQQGAPQQENNPAKESR